MIIRLRSEKQFKSTRLQFHDCEWGDRQHCRLSIFDIWSVSTASLQEANPNIVLTMRQADLSCRSRSIYMSAILAYSLQHLRPEEQLRPICSEASCIMFKNSTHSYYWVLFITYIVHLVTLVADLTLYDTLKRCFFLHDGQALQASENQFPRPSCEEWSWIQTHKKVF